MIAGTGYNLSNWAMVMADREETDMLIELKPEHERVIQRAAKSGLSQEQAIDQAFAILDEQYSQGDWMLAERDFIRRKIAAGLAQAERGESISSGEAIRILDERKAGRRIA